MVRRTLCLVFYAILGKMVSYSMLVDTVRIDGIRYELSRDGDDRTCTVLNSEDTIIYSSVSSKKIDYEKYSYYEGDIVIPETIRYNGLDYKVTGISDYAFVFCSELKSIRLPASLMNIGNSAFRYCVCLEDLKLPDSVNNLGAYAFADCHMLQSVLLSTSLDTIPIGLFANCYKLKEIEIPEGVEYVSYDVFSSCWMLKNISFPSTLKKIATYNKIFFQFQCESLANVYMHSVIVPKDDRYHSLYDENPESLNYGKKPCVLHVPAGSAKDYISRENWKYFYTTVEYDPETGPDYDFRLGDDVLYRNAIYSVMNIPKNTFIVDSISYVVLSEEDNTCSVVAGKILYHNENYVIPEKVSYEGKEYTVVSLSNYSFSGCSEVKSIILPETIKEISDNSLVACHSIESLRLPAAVETICLPSLASLKELIIESRVINVTQGKINQWLGFASQPFNIEDVYILNADDPTLVSLSFINEYRRSKPRLHVPEHALTAYESDPSFSNKWTLVGIPSDDPLLRVKATASVEPLNDLHYSLDGRIIDADAPGLHIIRSVGGRVSKVLVK